MARGCFASSTEFIVFYCTNIQTTRCPSVNNKNEIGHAQVAEIFFQETSMCALLFLPFSSVRIQNHENRSCLSLCLSYFIV